MTVELIYTILKVITAIIIIGIVGVIMVAGVTFIYSVFEDILKTNKNQTDDTVQFQDNIRPEEESQQTPKTD
jgi:hypothetical protein